MKTRVLKIIAILALVLALLTASVSAIKWGFNTVFQAGVDSEKAAQAQRQEAAIAEKQRLIDQANAHAKAWKQKAIAIEKQLKQTPKVTANDIKNAASSSPCAHLGHDTFQLWNAIIGEEPSYTDG